MKMCTIAINHLLELGVSLSQTGPHQYSSFSKSGDHILFLMPLKLRKNGIGESVSHLFT